MQTPEVLVFGIPRLYPPIKSEDGIQCFHEVLDCPVKPDNDNIKYFIAALIKKRDSEINSE